MGNPLIVAFLERYCGYRQKYIFVTSDKTVNPPRMKVITQPHHIDSALLAGHLAGKYAVGVFAGPRATKFISIDVDLGEPAVVHRVVDTLAELGIPRDAQHVSFSGKKGYHVDIFFDGPVWNNKALGLYKLMIAHSGLDERKVEFRPTHTQGIKLPLGVHQGTGNRCWFVNRETLEPIKDLNYLLGVKPIAPQVVFDIVEAHKAELYPKIGRRPFVERRGRGNQKVAIPSDLMVTETGTRHKKQMRIGMLARLRGCDESEIVDAQMAWYDAQNAALMETSRAEAESEAWNIAGWMMKHVTPSPQFGCAANDDDTAPAVKLGYREIMMVLKQRTKAMRMVLFLLLIYNKRYGSAKMAYSTMAHHLSVDEKTVRRSIAELVDNGMVMKMRGDWNYKDGGYDTNAYIICGKMPGPLPRKYVVADEITFDRWINRETFEECYLGALAGLCTEEYLAKYLTKPEMAKIRRLNADHGKTESV